MITKKSPLRTQSCTAPYGYFTATRSTPEIQFVLHCWTTPRLHLQSIHFPVVKEFESRTS
jgi:hypothetical protein